MMDAPDLTLQGLHLWIDGRQFPHIHDFWNGNWLMVRARMEAPGAVIRCEGAMFMTTDFAHFRDDLATMSATLKGEAVLGSLEPDVSVALKMIGRGHIEVEVNMSPDIMHQSHEFTFELDQTYLPDLIRSCDAILDRFPVIGTP